MPVKKIMMIEREIEECGTWVQCSLPSCHKWRYLPNVSDPTALPEVWTCPMNKDVMWNSCDVPEQIWDPDEEENFIFTKFTEGSLVWARMPGYPHWPALVEIDPDYDTYFECRGMANIVTHIHVVFFDEKVSRAWIASSNLRPFTGEEKVKDFTCTIGGVSYRKQIVYAREQAMDALKITLNERIEQFGFAQRFKGKWDIGKKSRTTNDSSHARQQPSIKASFKQIVAPQSQKTSSSCSGSVKGKRKPDASWNTPKSKSMKRDASKSPECSKAIRQNDVNALLEDCEAIIQDADKVLEEFLSSQGEKSEHKNKKLKKKKKKKDKNREKEAKENCDKRKEDPNVTEKRQKEDSREDKPPPRKPSFHAPKPVASKEIASKPFVSPLSGNISNERLGTLCGSNGQSQKTPNNSQPNETEKFDPEDDLFLDLDVDVDSSIKGLVRSQNSQEKVFGSQTSDNMEFQEE